MRENQMVKLEKEKIEKSRVSKEKERVKLSKEFFISVVMAIAAVSIIITLMNIIPILIDRTYESTQVNYNGKNFFFWWEYHEAYTDNPGEPWRYFLYKLHGNYGFFLLMIPAMIMLVVSNGVLVKNKREFTILTWINWSIYSLAIIGCITAWNRQITQLEEVSWIIGRYINFLTFYPMCVNVPLQIFALVEGMSFREWYDYQIKTRKVSTKRKLKKTFLVFAIVFYIGTWFWPLGYGNKEIIRGLYALFGIFYAAYLGTLMIYLIVNWLRYARFPKRQQLGSM
jgi:hypothetical protein